MAKPLDPRTVAIMDTLQSYPYPMTAAQLAESTEIPYTTLSRRLAVLVADGSLVIDAMSGPKGRTMFYKISGKLPTIKWMRGGIDKPEDVTLSQAIELIKEFPNVGGIDMAIGKILTDFVEYLQSNDPITQEKLAALKKGIDVLALAVAERGTVITSIQASPMWTVRAAETMRSGLLF